MTDTTKVIKHMVKVNSTIALEMSLKASGRMEWYMDMANI